MSDKLGRQGRVGGSLEAGTRGGKKLAAMFKRTIWTWEGSNENGLGQRFSMEPTLPDGGTDICGNISAIEMVGGGFHISCHAQDKSYLKKKGGVLYVFSNDSPDLHTCEKYDYNYLNLDSTFLLLIKYFLYNFTIHWIFQECSYHVT